MTDKLSETPPPSQADAALATGLRLADQGNSAELEALSTDLEAIYPVTELEWRSLCRIFSAMQRRQWSEIMTTRFLSRVPDHVDASLEKARMLSRADLTQEEAVAIILDRKPALVRIEQFLSAAQTCFGCRRGSLALEILQLAEQTDPSCLEIYRARFHYFVSAKHMKAAKSALQQFDEHAGKSVSALLTAIALALSIDDFEHSSKLLERAIANYAGSDQYVLRQFITISAKLGDFERIETLLKRIDPDLITDTRELEILYSAIEGHNFYAAEMAILARLVQLDPANIYFRSKKMSLENPFIAPASYDVKKTSSAEKRCAVSVNWIKSLFGIR